MLRTPSVSQWLFPALLACAPPWASAQEPWDAGWALFFDNDAFAVGTDDHDYTAGAALTLAGRRAAGGFLTLDGALGAIDRLVGLAPDGGGALHALQVASLAFTPSDIEAPDPVPGDRPYASLVYIANNRTLMRDDAVYLTSFSVGVLGLSLSETLQRHLHGALGATMPRGWDHQVSDGGEPTARYTVARLDPVAIRARGSARLELKTALAGSAGYLTDTSAALTLRWGAIHTAWWSFVPERAEYMFEPAPVAAGPSGAGAPRELYGWAGIKARARAYNAFLQGQFRDSDLAYSFGETRPLTAEAWAGVTGELGAGYRVSWVLRYHSPELRTEPGDRDLFWGGLSVSRSF